MSLHLLSTQAFLGFVLPAEFLVFSIFYFPGGLARFSSFGCVFVDFRIFILILFSVSYLLLLYFIQCVIFTITLFITVCHNLIDLFRLLLYHKGPMLSELSFIDYYALYWQPLFIIIFAAILIIFKF